MSLTRKVWPVQFSGFLRRYTLHLEWHPGYRPHVSLRPAPQHGDRVLNGDEPSTLERCSLCGDGFLARPDSPWQSTEQPQACP